MNVILSSYDQVSHLYVHPLTFYIHFYYPHTFHHPWINQKTDLKFLCDKIRSEAYNLLLLLLLLLLLFHGLRRRRGSETNFYEVRMAVDLLSQDSQHALLSAYYRNLQTAPLKQTKKSIKIFLFLDSSGLPKNYDFCWKIHRLCPLSFY